VTPSRRRLVALSVALAPGRAVDLLGRLGSAHADRAEALAEAAPLAEAPRRARLAALATALAGEPAARGAGLHPLLARLARERTARGEPPAGPRTGDRMPDSLAVPGARNP